MAHRLQVVNGLLAQDLCCADGKEAALRAEHTPSAKSYRHNALHRHRNWRVNKWLLHRLEIVTVCVHAMRAKADVIAARMAMRAKGSIRCRRRTLDGTERRMHEHRE